MNPDPELRAGARLYDPRASLTSELALARMARHRRQRTRGIAAVLAALALVVVGALVLAGAAT